MSSNLKASSAEEVRTLLDSSKEIHEDLGVRVAELWHALEEERSQRRVENKALLANIESVQTMYAGRIQPPTMQLRESEESLAKCREDVAEAMRRADNCVTTMEEMKGMYELATQELRTKIEAFNIRFERNLRSRDPLIAEDVARGEACFRVQMSPDIQSRVSDDDWQEVGETTPRSNAGGALGKSDELTSTGNSEGTPSKDTNKVRADGIVTRIAALEDAGREWQRVTAGLQGIIDNVAVSVCNLQSRLDARVDDIEGHRLRESVALTEGFDSLQAQQMKFEELLECRLQEAAADSRRFVEDKLKESYDDLVNVWKGLETGEHAQQICRTFAAEFEQKFIKQVVAEASTEARAVFSEQFDACRLDSTQLAPGSSERLPTASDVQESNALLRAELESLTLRLQGQAQAVVPFGESEALEEQLHRIESQVTKLADMVDEQAQDLDELRTRALDDSLQSHLLEAADLKVARLSEKVENTAAKLAEVMKRRPTSTRSGLDSNRTVAPAPGKSRDETSPSQTSQVSTATGPPTALPRRSLVVGRPGSAGSLTVSQRSALTVAQRPVSTGTSVTTAVAINPVRSVSPPAERGRGMSQQGRSPPRIPSPPGALLREARAFSPDRGAFSPSLPRLGSAEAEPGMRARLQLLETSNHDGVRASPSGVCHRVLSPPCQLLSATASEQPERGLDARLQLGLPERSRCPSPVSEGYRIFDPRISVARHRSGPSSPNLSPMVSPPPRVRSPAGERKAISGSGSANLSPMISPPPRARSPFSDKRTFRPDGQIPNVGIKSGGSLGLPVSPGAVPLASQHGSMCISPTQLASHIPGMSTVNQHTAVTARLMPTMVYKSAR